MTSAQAIKTCLYKYASISGRASRSEFWWFWLAHVLLPLAMVFLALFAASVSGVLASVLFYGGVALYLATFLPTHSALVRRFHDTGRTGKYSILFVLSVAAVMAALYILVVFLANTLTGGALEDPGAMLYILPGIVAIDAIMLGVLFVFVLGPLLLVALIIFIFLAVMLSDPSQPNSNKFGPNPHEVTP